MLHYKHEHPLCDSHGQYFDDAEDAHDHYVEHHGDTYCAKCRRLFIAAHNLQQHLNSVTHKPRNVPCIFTCGEKFISHSAMLLHLEQGRCASGTTRAEINRRIVQMDRGHIIVKPGVRRSAPPERWLVTDAMQDSYSLLWHCYLCNKTTRTREQMQMHLDSAAHDEKLFRCPGGCGKETSTLSGMMQHIESRACNAYAIIMRKLVGPMRRMLLN
ncbi:hypothetical protein AURDEDRAFT_109689 [Auricularia subglabra TFB-10046 SS5]|nr:hypothetical protein AURDEDRAFT_109689 [Auricularia subglabra TFB-10046 SS5]